MPPVIGREGDSVQIKCPYDEKHTEEMCLRKGKCLSKEVKYLCKGKCFTKDPQIIIRSDEDQVKNPKISVKDDTELNLFTVNMTELRAEDAGKYWCAVKDVFNLPIELMIIRKDEMMTSDTKRETPQPGESASQFELKVIIMING
ncbi:CMRF35-like molecule 2 [Carassius carassius]|uniref:CMRF35-like molecule 2 n=1 Tax=Carassius carassius TaxID=217509 RepID=UPI0028690F16|nr:CMRF35-like molecule 2 [Carassius carassius]